MSEYRELKSEIAQVRVDIGRTATASKVTTKINKEAIEETKRQLEAQERRIHTKIRESNEAQDRKIEDQEARVRDIEKEMPMLELRLAKVEKSSVDQSGKIQTIEIDKAKGHREVEMEKNKASLTKGKLVLIGTIFGTIVSGAVNLLVHLLK